MRKCLPRPCSTISCVTLLMVCAGPLSASVLPAVGPNTFGYSGSPIASNLRDISSSETFLGLGDEEFSSFISIGFDFDFYGSNISSLRVSSNGFLLPAGGGEIEGFFADLNNPQGNIRYQTLGIPGGREFVVGYYAVPRFLNDPPATFEMILHEGSNNIEFQYGTLNDDGSFYRVEIVNPSNVDVLSIRSSSSGPADFDDSGYLISTSAVIPEPSSFFVFGGLALCFSQASWRRKRRRQAL